MTGIWPESNRIKLILKRFFGSSFLANYFRNSIEQDRLWTLSILSVEQICLSSICQTSLQSWLDNSFENILGLIFYDKILLTKFMDFIISSFGDANEVSFKLIDISFVSRGAGHRNSQDVFCLRGLVCARNDPSSHVFYFGTFNGIHRAVSRW